MKMQRMNSKGICDQEFIGILVIESVKVINHVT